MRHNNVMCVVDFYKTTIKDLSFAFTHVCKWKLKEFYARGLYQVWFEDKGDGHIQAIYEGASAYCKNGEIVIDSSHDY